MVKDDGRIAMQAVRTGAVLDGMWLVSDGLKDGDRVVVDGFQKFLPGDKVKPQAWVDADASVGSLPDCQQTGRAVCRASSSTGRSLPGPSRCSSADRRHRDPAIADHAISYWCATVDLDLNQLSRRVAGKPPQQRHAAD